MPYTDSQLQAHRALLTAAERIGANNYRKLGKRFTVTVEHRAVIQASSDVLVGKISVNDAMALLHDYDVMEQRLGT